MGREAVRSRMKRRDLLTGLAFASPFIIGFLGLTLYWMVAAFYYGLTEYEILLPLG